MAARSSDTALRVRHETSKIAACGLLDHPRARVASGSSAAVNRCVCDADRGRLMDAMAECPANAVLPRHRKATMYCSKMHQCGFDFGCSFGERSYNTVLHDSIKLGRRDAH